MRGGHRKKKYAEMYRKMMKIVIGQIHGSFEEFGNDVYWYKVEVEGNTLISICKREEMKEMARTATKVWTLLSAQICQF